MNNPSVFKNPCGICKVREATLLCDYVTEYHSMSVIFVNGPYAAFRSANEGPRIDTCDLPMCEECAEHITDGVDFCPHHHNLHKQVRLPDNLRKYQRKQKIRQREEET
ncbi:hypothetical protein D3C74_312080 [compost metagenome]